MSSPHSPLPPVEVREAVSCMCAHGQSCSSFAPGHALHLIQQRMASATPSDWVDAIVEAGDPESGVLRLRTLQDGVPLFVWSAAGAAIGIAPGTPVSLHARYHVLAEGRTRVNVAPLRAND